MTWVRLNEEFPDHPKVAIVGPLAGWLHVCALCYCNRYLTDGFVPTAQVPRLADFTRVYVDRGGNGIVGAIDRPKPEDLAEELVEVGMWERIEGGYLIHDFHEYQPSRSDIHARRAVRAAAGSRGGKVTASKRASNRQANAAASAVASAQANGVAKSHPGPGPKDILKSSSYILVNARGDLEDDDDENQELEDALTAEFPSESGDGTTAPTPREQARAAALARLANREREVGPVGNREAWLRSAEAQILTSGDFSTPPPPGGVSAAWTAVAAEMSRDPNPRRIFDARTEAALEAAGGFGPLKSSVTAVEARRRFTAAWIEVAP